MIRAAMHSGTWARGGPRGSPYSREELIHLITMTLSPPSGGERRSEPRLPVSVDGSLASAEGQSQIMRVCSLSEGGAFVAMQETCAPETEVTISFRLDGDAIELKALVVYEIARRSAWQQAYPRGMGLQFIDLDADRKERLGLWAKTQIGRFTV